VNEHGRLDVAGVKQAAAGRWPEILAKLGGIEPEVLDGRHHPCPKCGGVDRFRLIDQDAGACLCNQCFAKGNGDGIAAVRWLCDWDFPTALREIGSYLGLNGQPVGKTQIVATYDYCDEAGELLFQVVRFHPKNFRQRRPQPGGGWDWRVKGVRVVPYRLPELIAADPAATVFIPEGEKDCDRLASIGLIATTNAGGAGSGGRNSRRSWMAGGWSSSQTMTSPAGNMPERWPRACGAKPVQSRFWSCRGCLRRAT